MPVRFLLSLFFLVILLVPTQLDAQPQKKPLLCGTSPATTAQELFLHERGTERRARLLRAGIRQAGDGGKAVDLERAAATVSGNIVVMRGDGGVVLGRNLFPGSLVGRTIQFQPADAAASTYLVALTDPPYRQDAVEGAAVNLVQPGSGAPIGDDDTREFDLPFPFPFYGRTHTRMFVNSNGHITFERPDSLAETSSFAGFLDGPPKIAGASMDLDPQSSPGGGIFVFLSPTEVIVSYRNIVEFGTTSNRVDFQIRIAPDGTVSILHMRGPFGNFVVGITPGGGLSIGPPVTFTNPPTDPLSQSIAEVFSGGTQTALDVFRASQVFYQHQPDDYDYLVFYNDANVPTGVGAVAFEITVRNQVLGIGEEILDRSNRFGSPARLEAIINMGPLSQYPDDPNGRVDVLGFTENTPLSVLAHEAGHRFLAFPRLREAGNNTVSLLGRQLAHWSFRFNAHGSFLEGSDLSAPPSGDTGETYVTGPTNQRYSELDRYLMGLIAPEQVGIEQSLFYVGGLGATARPPQAGVQITGPRRGFSMEDIIAANGRRVPDHTVAPRRFRFAFVLVTLDESKVQPALEKLDRYRREFEAYFNSRSGGLAVADTALKPGLNLNVAPAGAILSGSSGAFTVGRRDAGAELSLRLEGAAPSLDVAGSAVIPAGKSSTELPFTALQPGVARIRVEATNGEYLPVEAAVAVVTAEELDLGQPSPSRQQAAPNAEASSPIRVRVTDRRSLPVQGAPVRFEPLTGGSAEPSLGTTDANGEASFRWRVGPESVNEAAVFIDGQRARTERRVTARENLLPDLRAATNAASFATGISPGSLATLFGVSLAAGRSRGAAVTPLPTELEGVSVRVNGATVPLIFVSDLQINFYVPGSTSGGAARIVVNSPDGASNAFDAPLNLIQPGIFFDSGTNLGAVLRNNFGDKTNVVPAVPGDFVQIFATGLGPLVSPGRGVLITQFPVTIRIGDQVLATGDVPYAGIAPGFTGLYQVNARIPSNLSPGSYPLQLIVDGRESNVVNVIVGGSQ